MLPQIFEKFADFVRGNLLWVALSLLVVAQLAAFWMVCSQQVQQAQARVATIHAQRAAAPGHEAAAATGMPSYVAYR